jgi:hypothetical protein
MGNACYHLVQNHVFSPNRNINIETDWLTDRPTDQLYGEQSSLRS